MRWVGIWAVVFCGWAFVGCGSSKEVAGPETVPFTGKVVFTKGGSVTSLNSRSGRIEFQSVEQPEVRAYGAIAEDGTFEMATRIGESGKPGVLKGKHRVRLGLDDNAQHLVAPQFLNFERSKLTVEAPSEQPVEIKVWK